MIYNVNENNVLRVYNEGNLISLIKPNGEYRLYDLDEKSDLVIHNLSGKITEFSYSKIYGLHKFMYNNDDQFI